MSLARASVPRPFPPSFHPLEAPASLAAFPPPAHCPLALSVLLPTNPRTLFLFSLLVSCSASQYILTLLYTHPRRTQLRSAARGRAQELGFFIL